MTEKTNEQLQAEVNRLQKILQYMASSKADDAIFIAESKAIVNEQQQMIEHLQKENSSLKVALEQAIAPKKEGEKDEATTNK